MENLIIKLLTVIISIFIISACSGVRTIPNAVRAGDTAIIAVGWKHNFSARNIGVTITPSFGAPISYGPGNPAIRAVVNLYPDPVSSIVVSQEVNQDLTSYSRTYGNIIKGVFTGGDKDWWQTTVYIDLPASIPIGPATIVIRDPSTGDSATSSIEIIGGTGSPDIFYAEYAGPLTRNQLISLGRVKNYVVSISAATIPYAVQIKLQHDAASAYVINPRGDLKNAAWSDNTGVTNIVLTPAKPQLLSNINDFKIYIVATGSTVMNVTSIDAFDSNGNPVTGVTASLEYFGGVN